MNRRGVNYDVGLYPFGEARPPRAVFDPAIVRREMEKSSARTSTATLSAS
jgi:hypothetical protein